MKKFVQIAGNPAKSAKQGDVYTVKEGQVFYNGEKVDIRLEDLEEVDLHVIKRTGNNVGDVKKGGLYLGRRLILGAWAVFDAQGNRIPWNDLSPSGWSYFALVQD